jgi:pimeloyl-ACP methyl ester carboxylesterase
MRTALTAGLAVIGTVVGLKAFVNYYEKRMLFFPTRVHETTPDAAGVPHEDVSLTTTDGVNLHAWWIPAPEGTGSPTASVTPEASATLEASATPVAVLVLHGNAGNIGDRVHLAAGFRGEGFATLLLDWRGYGKSADVMPTEEGIYRDAEAGWEELLRRGFTPDRIILFGESLGGAVASWMAERHPDCRAVILDATFSSARDMGAEVLPLPGIENLVTLGLNSVDRLGRTPVPVLLFHGMQDRVIPFAMSERIFAAAAGRKEFVRVPGGSHCDACFILGDEYYRKIREFTGS